MRTKVVFCLFGCLFVSLFYGSLETIMQHQLALLNSGQENLKFLTKSGKYA